MKSAQDIANFFLSHSYDGEMDDLTNLKLQKLLYYTQGYSLALLGRPIFDDSITAWDHGPVVETIYQSYKQYGRTPLPALQNYSLSKFDDDELIVLNKVADNYGEYSPWCLRNMTHEEEPWCVTPRNSYIDEKVIMNFFIKKLNSSEVKEKSFNFDLAKMQQAVEAPSVRVPKLDSPEAILAWMNSLTDSDFVE